jgi:hypothetical protein
MLEAMSCRYSLVVFVKERWDKETYLNRAHNSSVFSFFFSFSVTTVPTYRISGILNPHKRNRESAQTDRKSSRDGLRKPMQRIEKTVAADWENSCSGLRKPSWRVRFSRSSHPFRPEACCPSLLMSFYHLKDPIALSNNAEEDSWN